MSKYNLFGKEITFSKAEDDFCDLQFFVWKAIEEAKETYEAWHTINHNITKIINNSEDFVSKLIKDTVLEPLYSNLAKSYDIYGVNKVEYFDICLDISSIDEVIEDAIEIYNNIQGQLQDELEERAYNEELRRAGQISFGIGDSLKNAASNAAHGIANSSGNASSREQAEKRMSKLYNDVKAPLWNAIKNSIVTSSSNYQDLVNEKKPDSIISYFDRGSSDAYLDNAKNIKDKREELLIESFQKCPWNCNLLAYIFKTYPDERRNIIEIAKKYRVDLTEDIDHALRLEYTGNCKSNEAAAVAAKAKIKDLMNEWGVEKSIVIDEIERDCLDRLTRGYNTATEERCNELKKSLEEYDATPENKKPYFEKLQQRIEEIWAKEDGEIFDNYLMQADLLSHVAIEEGKAYVKEKGRTADSQKYYQAFEACTLWNIKKARLYNILNRTTASTWIFKLLGWALIAFGWIYAAFVEDFSLIDALPAFIGVIYQCLYSHIKKKWSVITVNGTVVNPIITLPQKEFEAKCTILNQDATSTTNNNNDQKTQ